MQKVTPNVTICDSYPRVCSFGLQSLNLRNVTCYVVFAIPGSPPAQLAEKPAPMSLERLRRPDGPSPRLTWSGEPNNRSSGIERMPMKRHDDSQRSDRSAMTAGHFRVVDRVAASIASLARLGFDGSVMNCHDDSHRSGRLAVTQPVPPCTFRQ